MGDFYVSKRFSADPKHVKVESGFGLAKNEANLDHARNSISTADKLAKSWTKPNQGMSKFPMNDKNIFNKQRKGG